jgi:hypothetical protein
VGTRLTPPTRAFAWNATTGATAELPGLSAEGTTATDVSPHGTVLGKASLGFVAHTVLWSRRH